MVIASHEYSLVEYFPIAVIRLLGQTVAHQTG